MKINRTITYTFTEKDLYDFFEDDEFKDYTEENFNEYMNEFFEFTGDFEYNNDFTGDITECNKYFLDMKKKVLTEQQEEATKEKRTELLDNIEYYTQRIEEAKKKLAEMGE